VDGLQYFSVNPGRIPSGTAWVYTQPQFLLLNVAVGGQWPGNPDGTTSFPQQMLVDYVRVYAPANLPACRANLLNNPGFEVGGLANWTAYGAGFNTLLQNITNAPVHDGTNAFKVYGQFNGSQNYSGLYQDFVASPGQSFVASGWAFTPYGDSIAGSNAAWIEVTFRDSATNIIGLYRSATIDTNNLFGVWLNLGITNQFDPHTSALLGPVTNLVAPAGTAFGRYQPVFLQPQSAAGSVLFDDLQLSSSVSTDFPTLVQVSKNGKNLHLSFPTYLGLPYQVRYKNELNDPAWSVLTNVIGDGSSGLATDGLVLSNRFYRVSRVCN
jgi:hypothetical protein